MSSRLNMLLAITVAGGTVAACIAVLYFAGVWLLPRMPGWGLAIIAIIGALLFIISPITALKIYDRALQQGAKQPRRGVTPPRDED